MLEDNNNWDLGVWGDDDDTSMLQDGVEVSKETLLKQRALKEFCNKNKRCNHVYTHNHSKVLAVKTETGYYVFEGSGNMSDNARIEQYVYEESKDVYNFHKGWMNELIDK